MATSKKNYESDNSTMSLGDHLEELRMRLLLALGGLVLGAIVCLIFGTKIISFIEWPYHKVNPGKPLTTLAPTDAFVGYMKVSLISGLVLTAPWVFYQLWKFISAGLYPHEKKYVHLAAPFTAGLFIIGALFFLFGVAPLSLSFLKKFGEIINTQDMWTFQKYITFITLLMLVFGLGFQTPVAIFFLHKTGLVSISSLGRARKYVLLGIFILAAVVTPPDIITQVTLAIPLYMLFEFGILLSYISERRAKRKES